MKPLKILLLSALLCTAAIANAADKIGIVNMQKVLLEAPYAKRIKADIERELKPLSDKLKSKAQEVNNAQQSFTKNQATMSAEQRRKAEQNLREQMMQVKMQEANLADELRGKEQEALNKLGVKVEAAIGDIAKKHGYSLILRGETVLFGSPSYDVTDKLIKALK